MTLPAAEVLLDIERVVAGGDGLARHDSLVVLVPRTLAGEQVRARVTTAGKVGRGALVSVERPSAARVEPQCAHYTRDSCGGCQLQHADYAEQMRIKAGLVEEAFRRIARRPVPLPAVRPAPSPWRYRRKLTLSIRASDSRGERGWIAGLRRVGRPDDVFSLEDCAITDSRVLDIWRAVVRAAGHFPREPRLGGVARVESDGTTSFTLRGATDWPEAQQFFDAVPGISALWWVPDRGRERQVATRGTGDAARRSGSSFGQVNADVARAMQDYVCERVRAWTPTHVVDAYAGIGDTAAALAAAGIRVTAIELDRSAAAWAATRLPAPSRVRAARVEDALPRALPADVIVVNPPRSGLDATVCAAIAGARPRPRALIYVSCDPATLARDVARLGDWRIASLTCFDMFPHTAHVETVCELLPPPGEGERT